jgi:hypothetical protein
LSTIRLAVCGCLWGVCRELGIWGCSPFRLRKPQRMSFIPQFQSVWCL